MSGGTFSLRRWHLETFSEELEEWLQQHGSELDPLAAERLRNLVGLSRQVGQLVHAADYLAAGDYGPETFNAAWEDATKDPS
jgi:hypothetical protein